MQSRLLFSILVIAFVVVCILLTIALRRLATTDRSPETSHGFTFGPHVLTTYGRFVWSTLDWLDDHHVPVNGFVRTVIDRLRLLYADGHALHPRTAEEQPTHQLQDLERAVSSILQQPPLAYH